MITVQIKINYKPIHTVHAVNVSEANGLSYGKKTQLYYVYDDNAIQMCEIRHEYNNGAIELAKKMLEKLEEV